MSDCVAVISRIKTLVKAAINPVSLSPSRTISLCWTVATTYQTLRTRSQLLARNESETHLVCGCYAKSVKMSSSLSLRRELLALHNRSIVFRTLRTQTFSAHSAGCKYQAVIVSLVLLNFHGKESETSLGEWKNVTICLISTSLAVLSSPLRLRLALLTRARVCGVWVLCARA